VELTARKKPLHARGKI